MSLGLPVRRPVVVATLAGLQAALDCDLLDALAKRKGFDLAPQFASMN